MSVEAPKPDVLLVQSRGEALHAPDGHLELGRVFGRMRRRREFTLGSVTLAIEQAGGRVRVYNAGEPDATLSPVALVALPDSLPVMETLYATEYEGGPVAAAWSKEIDMFAGLIDSLRGAGMESDRPFIAEPAILAVVGLSRLNEAPSTIGGAEARSMTDWVKTGVGRLRESVLTYPLLTPGLLSPSDQDIDWQTDSIVAKLTRFVPELRPPNAQEAHHG